MKLGRSSSTGNAADYQRFEANASTVVFVDVGNFKRMQYLHNIDKGMPFALGSTIIGLKISRLSVVRMTFLAQT